MIRVNYFASIREAINRQSEKIELPANVKSVQELVGFLAGRDALSKEALTGPAPVLIAVNQTVVSGDFALKGDEEVAFFPPMTGG